MKVDVRDVQNFYVSSKELQREKRKRKKGTEPILEEVDRQLDTQKKVDEAQLDSFEVIFRDGIDRAKDGRKERESKKRRDEETKGKREVRKEKEEGGGWCIYTENPTLVEKMREGESNFSAFKGEREKLQRTSRGLFFQLVLSSSLYRFLSFLFALHRWLDTAVKRKMKKKELLRSSPPVY